MKNTIEIAKMIGLTLLLFVSIHSIKEGIKPVQTLYTYNVKVIK